MILGIPNVGKSSFINRVTKKNSAQVGNKPGVTKNLDWIRINDNMELLDSPGILWPKLDEEKVAFNLASLTAIKEEILPLYDVCEYIIHTLYNYYPEILKQRFGIENVDENLREVAILRCENPDLNLSELGSILSVPLTKSGVNHRLKKLLSIADKLIDKDEK